MSPVFTPLAILGRSTLSLLAAIGGVAIYTGRAVSHILRPPFYPREFLWQLLHIGWLSLPVVGLTALFTGGALALQIYAGGSRFNAEAVVPQIVAIGIVRELGPRPRRPQGRGSGSPRPACRIAAEIGHDEGQPQIDARGHRSTTP